MSHRKAKNTIPMTSILLEIPVWQKQWMDSYIPKGEKNKVIRNLINEMISNTESMRNAAIIPSNKNNKELFNGPSQG